MPEYEIMRENSQIFANYTGTGIILNLTYYMAILGGLTTSSLAETATQTKINNKGLISNVRLNINTNSRAANTYYTLRDSVNAIGPKTIAAGVTGEILYTDTFALVAGDVINHRIDCLDVGAGSFQAIIQFKITYS